jgi:hypothetical protein
MLLNMQAASQGYKRPAVRVPSRQHSNSQDDEDTDREEVPSCTVHIDKASMVTNRAVVESRHLRVQLLNFKITISHGSTSMFQSSADFPCRSGTSRHRRLIAERRECKLQGVGFQWQLSSLACTPVTRPAHESGLAPVGTTAILNVM